MDSLSYKLIEFDQNGFVTSETFFNPITRYEAIKVYVRDDFGYRESSTTTDHTGKILQTETYEYKGNLLKQLVVKSDNSISEFKYEYFENDSIKKFEKYVDGKISFYSVWEYDTASNETNRKMFNDQNNLTFEFISSVNEARNMLMHTTLMYNEDRPGDPPFATMTNQIFFDQNNNIELTIKYDKWGNSSQESYDYEFDKTDNWILQKALGENGIGFCIKREIEYYD